MGQKVDPRGLRIGIVKTWNSSWFAEGKEYLNNFHEDLKIKDYIKKNYYHAGISNIYIERNSETEVTVIIETAKAGILIGRKGQEIEALRAKLEKMTGKKVNAKALEVKNPNKDAQLVAESIATAVEKRVAYKRAMQQAIQRAEKSGVKGIKIMVSGRLNGAEIARSEWTLSGRVPLHTLRADIDYATATAQTTYGALGIKVWIFNGEVLPTKEGGNK
ncbi:30S ribosomal protein S3 [Oceanivirga salmonicida]|uniref:30S ribosomal protein S3 n=1 Tax=Oceanivirga salmonicida TaxID=1769291 RepID=UPI000829E479|nr:30S ribosomal protein S3 [Oceanivirga salmonicida]